MSEKKSNKFYAGKLLYFTPDQFGELFKLFTKKAYSEKNKFFNNFFFFIDDQQQNTNPEHWPRRSKWNVWRALVSLRAGHASIPRHVFLFSANFLPLGIT